MAEVLAQFAVRAAGKRCHAQPVEQPIKFGLEISPTLLAGAHEVIK
jgi:hypothetical protein